MLDALGKSKYFSTLDLESSYWQVAMDPKDCPKTAFTTQDRNYKLIQEQKKETILYNMHSDPSLAHFGKDSTTQKTLEYYFWPQMRKDIHKYVKSCDSCQRREGTHSIEPLNPIKVGQLFD
ncbi:hypothetical protein G9A89_018100 [Geosiphon pyriformis]|nr:hypothetical protein G9A89_018100 [Geosiphon pyriformis]